MGTTILGLSIRSRSILSIVAALAVLPVAYAVPVAERGVDAMRGVESTQPVIDGSLGARGGFPASGVQLLGRVPLSSFEGAGGAANDIWGYVSPAGREYAIIGLPDSVGFVDVTDPVNPVIVGQIFGPGSTWRDMKVYAEHCFVVIESTGNGMQIIDLTDIDNGNVALVRTTTLGVGLHTAHNIALNPASGYAYPVLADSNRGITTVDVSTPGAPRVDGEFFATDLHDVLVVTYTSGPYAGREIAFGFGEQDGLQIIDVTDKSNMFLRSSLLYPNTTYCHQGWLSEDRRYVFIGDELDELDNPNVTTTTTYVVDVQDLDNPVYVTSFTNGLPAIDHNMIVRGNLLYQANYASGMRVYNISNVNSVQEVAYFDTFPEHDAAGFAGAWGVYPLLPSGIVLVSDRQRGLFVLRLDDCNGNGIDDQIDIADGTSEDCNSDAVPDECQYPADCNSNGTQDICDIAGGVSGDCDANHVPDECETLADCNGNGLPDACDIAGGISDDCNANGIPDECDLDGGGATDLNGNGVPDECDSIVPVLLPQPPNDVPSNRYVAFIPADSSLVAFLIALAPEGGDPIPLGWIAEPVDPGCPNACTGQLVARIVDTPVIRSWTESVVRVADCQIVPDEIYEVQTTIDSVTLSEPTTLLTTPAPVPQFWADCVGSFDGVSWTAPNGIVNFTDISAAVLGFQVAPTAPPVFLVDVSPETPNGLINFADIDLIVKGFQGNTYPFSQPADCP